MPIRRGMSRTVWLVGRWAIKVPRARHGARFFVLGMLGNLNEAERWRLLRHPRLAPVRACGPLGLWLVQPRYRHFLGRRLTRSERAAFPILNLDDNGANVAVGPTGLVLVDYGNPDWYLVLPAPPAGRKEEHNTDG